MTWHFVRIQDSGAITAMVPPRVFATKAEAKKAAPDLLANRRGGGRIALAELTEEVIQTSTVRYEPFTGKP